MSDKKVKKDNIVKNALILMTITLLAGMLLGFTYEITKEPIARQKEIATNNALKAVLPMADKFEKGENKDETGSIKDVYAAYNGDDIIGYAFLVSAAGGYGGDVEIMVGMSTIDDVITGIDVLKHNETPGLGAKADEDEFKAEFAGEKLGELKVVKYFPSETELEISAISGATITSRCVSGGVNTCVAYLNEYLKGGK